MQTTVRVRDCKYIRHSGRLYGPGETFRMEESDWSLAGIGRLVELEAPPAPIKKAKKKIKIRRRGRSVR